MSKLRRHHGFTFVELMLVVVILAVAAGISGYYFVNTYQSASLRNAVRKLVLMGKYARMYAVEKGQSCWIYLDQEEKRFFLMVPDDESGEGISEPAIVSNPYCRQAALENGIAFELVRIDPITESDEIQSGAGHSIYFYPDGTCDAAVIQMGNGQRSMTTVFSSAYTKIKLFEGPADSVEEPMQAIDLDAMN